jgi:hypothetical protein
MMQGMGGMGGMGGAGGMDMEVSAVPTLSLALALSDTSVT